MVQCGWLFATLYGHLAGGARLVPVGAGAGRFYNARIYIYSLAYNLIVQIATNDTTLLNIFLMVYYVQAVQIEYFLIACTILSVFHPTTALETFWI